MPKLRAIFSRVSRPFWWPITTTERPSKRARPPTMAASSPKTRSPCSSRKSSKSSLHQSRVCGRLGWRASCVRCHGVRAAYVFWRRRARRSSSLAISSRTRSGSSSAWSAAMRFSSSSNGCSNSSASGILDHHRGGAHHAGDLARELGGGVHGDAARTHHHLHAVEQHVDEHGHAAGMLFAHALEGSQGGGGISRGRHADAARARLPRPTLRLVRQRLVEDAN